MATSMRLKYLMNTSRFARFSVTVVAQQCRHVHFAKPQSLPNLHGVRCNSVGRRWPGREMVMGMRMLSTESVEKPTEEEEEYHSIIKDVERAKGESDKKEFQAETRKLLDIVAKSLYSEKEVFIRELISNASDALEKLRYLQLSSPPLVGAAAGPEKALEIHIATDEAKKTFTIQDTGVGMTKEELIDNLGIIAKSGTKSFLDKLGEAGSTADKNMIGQFGVGFYSSFMVGENVDVYTKSHKANSPAYKWSSKGQGEYEICEAENVERGTKIVIHLKGDCYDFSKEETIREVIQKYSNFVGVPIYLNGKRVNVVQALWMMETRDITEDMHEEFYRFVTNSFDRPRFRLHYKADAPINIRALFYVPEYKPTLFDMSRETDVAVTLYSRKVMILAKANHILPRWLRFVKGVVDSEDIPLNLSRELLQDSALIRKLRWALTNRLLKFFQEQAKKDPAKYQAFYEDYGLFFREGIVTSPDQKDREEISKLLRFESSKLDPGQKTSLVEYGTRMKAGDRNIYFFSAPSRHLAETSPYMEAMKAKNIEVLFCYEPYDELVLMNLAQFENKHLKSIENELQEDSPDSTKVETQDGTESLSQEQANDLMAWLQVTLGNKIQKAKVTNRLESHPCILSITEMGAARHFLRTALADKSEDERFRILQPTLEINPRHPIIMKLHQLKDSDPELAKLVTDQIYDNAMIAAGLIDDPRSILNRMNELLSKALAKH